MPSFPIIVPSSTTGTGPTLLLLRNRLADELGFYHSTTVSDTGDNGDAARVVVADEFRDDEAGYDYLGQTWLYAQNGAQAGSQRRIVSDPDGGYLGSMGAVVLSRPFASSLLAGTTIEITNPLPVKRTLAVKGLNDCINEGLSRIWCEARLSITGDGTTSYSLASYPWLTRYEQTRGIYDDVFLDPTAEPELSPYPYQFVTTGADRRLVVGRNYTSAETFQLAVMVRADRYVSDGTTWGYATTPGLLGDAYQAAVPEEWAVTFGMVIALRQLVKMTLANKKMDKDERQLILSDLLSRKAQWAAAAAAIKRTEMPDPVQEPTETLVYSPSMALWS